MLSQSMSSIMHKMKSINKTNLRVVIFLIIALFIFIFAGYYYYQLRSINIYIDTNNQCFWSNGKIVSGTNAIQEIKTIKIHRYQLASRQITADKNRECLSTTYQGNY